MHKCLLFALLALVAAEAAAAGEWTVSVAAGRYNRSATPIVIPAPQGITPRHSLSLSDDKERCIPIQLSIADSQRQLVWVLQRPLAAGTKRVYSLTSTESPRVASGTAGVSCDMEDGHLIVRSGNRPVLRYNARVNRGPAGQANLQARNGYVHPIYSPDGTIITDDFAPDHVHQRGLFFAWTKCRFKNRAINFWEIQQGVGKIEHVGLQHVQSGDVFAQFSAQHRFVDTHDPSAPKNVLDEVWTLRVYNVPKGFLFDLRSQQTGSDEAPLMIGPYHYGGLALRGRREWIDPSGEDAFAMVTSAGLDRVKGNHSRPEWVDFGGRLEGAFVGLTAFCHPDNDRFPQPVRLHPSKPYFCFAPLVDHQFRIDNDSNYVSRYRFHVYSGPKNPDRAKRFWQDYATPPVVDVSDTVADGS